MNENTKPITVVITCAIQSGKVEMARRELEANIKLVMANEPACLGIRVYDDPKKPQRLLIVENWESKEIFNGPHMQTPHRKKFQKKADNFLDGDVEFSFWNEIIVAP